MLRNTYRYILCIPLTLRISLFAGLQRPLCRRRFELATAAHASKEAVGMVVGFEDSVTNSVEVRSVQTFRLGQTNFFQ